jgi:hypothetical protein
MQISSLQRKNASGRESQPIHPVFQSIITLTKEVYSFPLSPVGNAEGVALCRGVGCPHIIFLLFLPPQAARLQSASEK